MGNYIRMCVRLRRNGTVTIPYAICLIKALKQKQKMHNYSARGHKLF